MVQGPEVWVRVAGREWFTGPGPFAIPIGDGTSDHQSQKHLPTYVRPPNPPTLIHCSAFIGHD